MEITKCPVYYNKKCMYAYSDAGNCKDVTNCILKNTLCKNLDKEIRDTMLGIIYTRDEN